MEDVERLVDTVYTVLRVVREACRNPCARPICEELEDTLMLLLDEAGDTEQVAPTALRAIEQAVAALTEATEKARRNGCSRAAVLFEQAVELLVTVSGSGQVVG